MQVEIQYSLEQLVYVTLKELAQFRVLEPVHIFYHSCIPRLKNLPLPAPYSTPLPSLLPILQQRVYILALMFSVMSMTAAEGQREGMGGTPLALCSTPISG